MTLKTAKVVKPRDQSYKNVPTVRRRHSSHSRDICIYDESLIAHSQSATTCGSVNSTKLTEQLKLTDLSLESLTRTRRRPRRSSKLNSKFLYGFSLALKTSRIEKPAQRRTKLDEPNSPLAIIITAAPRNSTIAPQQHYRQTIRIYTERALQ